MEVLPEEPAAVRSRAGIARMTLLARKLGRSAERWTAIFESESDLTCGDEEWVRELEVEGIEPLPTKLVDKRLIRREGALLMRARLRGWEVYVLGLLESQSSSDRFMALRMATYACLVWLSLVERSCVEAGEPALRELLPVFPVSLITVSALGTSIDASRSWWRTPSSAI